MAEEPMTPRADACPDLETLAAFLDHRLSEPERETMAAHLATCETCYAMFVETAQIRPPRAVVSEARWWSPRRLAWPAAGLAAAAAVLLALTVSGWRWSGADEPALEALVAAVGTERPIEPRLTGGFAYGPVRGPVRAGEPAVESLPPDVRIAAAEIEKVTDGAGSPDALHASAVASLLTGDVDRAVATLERAVADHPGTAALFNDLAAAYLVRAGRRVDDPDLALALGTVNRALESDRVLPEARFNRALVLERLGQADQARDAWRAYLTLDDRSGWADEARTRLQALSEPR